MLRETPHQGWDRLRRAVVGVPLPAAIVDLDALEANVDRVSELARVHGKRVRIATKSIRSPALVKRVRARGGDAFVGLMTYTAAETAFWAAEGERDLLLAYPTVQASDLDALCAAKRAGAQAAVVVDCEAHVAALGAAARAAGVRLPVVIDLDVAYRPVGQGVHIGVRRSPLRDPGDVVALAERIARDDTLEFRGIMAYEAQIAGVADRAIGWKGPLLRWMKRRSASDVAAVRARIVAALVARGLEPRLFNGGGTGSLPSACADPSLTEVTAGSAFLCGHLFDRYEDVRFRPAAYFALQVVRRPTDDTVTCHGGGLVASGAAGVDRLPIPTLPAGLALLALEGAGEVQTPVRVPRGVSLALGDPIFFRHAKAGEPAEHFDEYLLCRGDRVEERVKTYRGLGRCWGG